MTLRLHKKTKTLLAREDGTIFKGWDGKLTVALIYPNIYSLGMSNLGFQSIYSYLNQLDNVVCERAFLPDSEDEEEYMKKGSSLFSLESQTALNRFDVLAFSISFEEDYLNIPKILSFAGVSLLSEDRDRFQPLVMAGGVATFMNPEPIADFTDFFALGEGEALISDIFPLLLREKFDRTNKETIIENISHKDGVYVPRFYNVTYEAEGSVESFNPRSGVPERIRKRIAEKLNTYPPVSPILTPGTEFSNMSLLEVNRGCPRGCRFCTAGFIYLPPRERSLDDLKKGVENGIGRGAKAGFLGTAVSESPFLEDLLSFVEDKKGEASISSIRMETLSPERLRKLKNVGYKTITIAPEAGSERLRRVINKDFSDEEILNTVDMIKESEIRKVKLYYMIGLPTERDDDIDSLISLSLKIRERFDGLKTTFVPVIALSINPFIPKPWTPFQWYPMEDVKVLKSKIKKIKNAISKVPKMSVKFTSPRMAYVQALLSLGDRRVGSFISMAFEEGVKSALKEMTPSPEFFVYRQKDLKEILPWDFIDHGIKKDYLKKEYKRGIGGLITPPCDLGSCVRCGVC